MTDDPDLALLTGPDVDALLGAALATSDEQLVSYRVRQVDHRPGSGTTVAYDATVDGPTGRSVQLLAASTAQIATPLPDGVLQLSDGETTATVWRSPLDPGLPGLATALDPAAVVELLGSYGVSVGEVHLRLRSYRPRRRAVVEVTGTGCRVFLKVVRPHAVAALHGRHRLLVDAGVPAPRSLGWRDDGLLLLEASQGSTLRSRLREPGSPVPTGEALRALLDSLPAAVCALPRRASWTDSADHYADVLASVLPAESDRCRALAARIAAATVEPAADEPTHGDFYETQLLLTGERITGLLDVDTLGPGRRADDLACLLAHVSVLAQMEPAHRSSSHATGAAWLADLDQHGDPVDLRARVAGVVLSLATGPHRVQEPQWQQATRDRLALAEQWLDSASRLGAPA